MCGLPHGRRQSTKRIYEPLDDPSLENVGCESCHGPASRHEQDPKIAMGKVGMQACLQCHIPQQSPNFDFAKYGIKIKH